MSGENKVRAAPRRHAVALPPQNLYDTYPVIPSERRA